MCMWGSRVHIHKTWGGETPGPCTGIVSVSAAATRVELRLRFGRFICLDWGFVRVKVNSNSNSNCQLASTYEDQHMTSMLTGCQRGHKNKAEYCHKFLELLESQQSLVQPHFKKKQKPEFICRSMATFRKSWRSTAVHVLFTHAQPYHSHGSDRKHNKFHLLPVNGV